VSFASVWPALQNPISYAIPVFFVCVGIEVAFYVWDASHEARAVGKGYLRADSRASLMMGTGALFLMIGIKFVTLIAFSALWVYAAPWHIPASPWWSWLLITLVVDLSWYCNHRFSHRVRIGWAGHQAHHSSEYFNFTTALRQKWNPWSEVVFWLPLPLLGFQPKSIYVVFGANLVYQFFSHTETVPKLWKPVEFVFNTPSHHRVHHGSDPVYLDRNYGGILIIWDRLLGTFQEEIHLPTYGLTTPVGSYNVLYLQYHEYGNLWRDVKTATSLRDKLGYVFGPPGWNPADGAPQLPGQKDPVRRPAGQAV